jgi:hypothetical protein
MTPAPARSTRLPCLPRRDARSRASLADAARAARPVVLARDRVLPVDGALAGLLPDDGLTRGTVVAVGGRTGAGVTSLVLELAAAATRLGEWAAVVDPEGTVGGLAAGEAGIALERFAVVRQVPVARWAPVVAAMLDGVSLVVAGVPRSARAGDARRLLARTRERGSVLVAVGPWPVEAALRLRAEASTWAVPPAGPGVLGARTGRVTVEGRGVAPGPPVEIRARAS